MNSSKQSLLIDVLLGTPDLFALVTPILQSRYFDPEYRQLMTFVMDYQQQYRGIPSPDIVKAETGIEVNPQTVEGSTFKYACDEFETFCKRKAIDYAIRDSVALVEKGDYGAVENKIRDAVTTSLTRNLGTDFFLNPAELLERTQQSLGVPISTGWAALDEAIGGGVYKKDLIIFSANSGGGKSITMDNLAANWHGKLRGVYFSFELSEEMLAKRHFAMVTEIDSPQLFARKNEVIAKTEELGNKPGDFIYVRMAIGTKPSQIRAYLKEYELKYGFTPDYMIMDYMGRMGSDINVAVGDTFARDESISEGLREIGNDYDAIIITASQQNRSAVGVMDIDHSHIAGGISKINTCDLAISIIFNDSMKANGEMAFQLIKTRNSDGVGKTVQLKWVGKYLRIVDHDNPENAIRYQFEKNQKTLVDGKDPQTKQRKEPTLPPSLINLIDA